MSGDAMLGRPVILCGFMGCGKTTVGRILSERLNRRFFDLDEYICNKHNMTVSEIFQRFGEKAFRDYEHLACCELAEYGDVIIATGGGTVTLRQNVDALHKAGGIIIFLDVPLEIITKRLLNDSSRPLVDIADDEKKAEEIKRLYNERYEIYKSVCDIRLAGGEFSDKTAEEAEKLLKNLPNDYII